jgi:hypothetical protein
MAVWRKSARRPTNSRQDRSDNKTTSTTNNERYKTSAKTLRNSNEERGGRKLDATRRWAAVATVQPWGRADGCRPSGAKAQQWAEESELSASDAGTQAQPPSE